MQPYDAILDFPPCPIGVHFTGEALTQLTYLRSDTRLSRDLDHRAATLAAELKCYLHHPEHHFDLLFVANGTPFQLRVWRALLSISPGQTLTYGTLAAQLKTAPRAVGQACAANPLPLVIPCHRVVSANGLGGFMHAASGVPLDIKAWLLRHERGNLGSDTRLPSSHPKPACGRGSKRDAQTS